MGRRFLQKLGLDGLNQMLSGRSKPRGCLEPSTTPVNPLPERATITTTPRAIILTTILIPGYTDKSGYAQCVFSLCVNPGTDPVTFDGRCPGKIVPPRGSTSVGGVYALFLSAYACMCVRVCALLFLRMRLCIGLVSARVLVHPFLFSFRSALSLSNA